MKKKILIFLLTLIVSAGFIYSDWLKFIYHLAEHQFYIFTNQYQIHELIDKFNKKNCNEKETCVIEGIQFTSKEIQSMKLIQSVKEFGKKIYKMPETKSYEKFIPIQRKELGWNLTVAYPLELKIKKFYFPFVGNFGYLGFFNKDVFNEWQNKFKKEGYDTYHFIIGAYSTIGYFSDPIFSTYLNYSKFGLIKLILHEMAHEKLYFKDDSSFSESLASFIDRYAAIAYLKDVQNKKVSEKNQQKFIDEYNIFVEIIESYKKKLIKLFASDISDQKKIKRKKEIYSQLRDELKKTQEKFKYYSLERVLSKKEFNNAFLINTRRYSPRNKGFKKIFKEKCNSNFVCWFTDIEKLKNCSIAQRNKFIDGWDNFEDFLENCHPDLKS